ncbi:VTT domain-containing protein [Actomonas aquatica]|uniref:VTT domain-containing protein n=1 Tax=Actomonas aquatica TaxID=2866162 RepID=A0ABZ1CI82_9BACT|nr:VTT domain-containing protein [Opitutus sp. WL0086]WRQ89955.1 VTT domain-containing protein [Opitutus sp. WL0086]
MDLLIPSLAGPHALVRQRMLRRRILRADTPASRAAGTHPPHAAESASPPPEEPPPENWRERARRFWRDHRNSTLVVALLFIVVPLAWGRVDFERMHDWAEHVNPALLFAALVLLPLVTVPVTPLNILAGIRFGLVGGLTFVAAAIIVQHVLAYFVARVLPGLVRRKLDPLRQRLPRNAHADATVFTSLIPGAPYWAQLYVLPLIGVPLFTYVLLSSGLHTIRSLTAIIAGEISDDPSIGWGIALLVYGTTLAITCVYAGRRMARKYRDHPPATMAET